MVKLEKKKKKKKIKKKKFWKQKGLPYLWDWKNNEDVNCVFEVRHQILRMTNVFPNDFSNINHIEDRSETKCCDHQSFI
jgi:hypothetical protein